MKRTELFLLEALAGFIEAKTIVEVGVFKGETTRHLIKAAEKIGGHVYGFDIWETHGLKKQFRHCTTREELNRELQQEGYKSFSLFKINTIENKSDFSELLKYHCKNGIDLAFIDGCHSYTGIKNDFSVVYPMLTETGIVVFHDTLKIDGCREFILDLRTKYNDGTFDIVDLPFGNGKRRSGLTMLVKRTHPIINEAIDEICGSISTPSDIEKNELEWYKTQINEKTMELPNKDKLIDCKYGSINRKKFE